MELAVIVRPLCADRFISDNSGALTVRVTDTGTPVRNAMSKHTDQWSG
jgi:hypothetical protein